MVDKERLDKIISLIEDLHDGNLEAFNEFYELTKKNVYITIYSTIKDKDLSEDVLQDTYVKFLEVVTKLDLNSNPYSYLYMIARNTSIDYIKKRKYVSYVDISEKEEIIPDVINGKDNDIDSNELITNLKKILKKEEFEIVILHIINELTFKEIAGLKNKSINTILWAYNNAIKKAQKRIKKEEGE